MFNTASGGASTATYSGYRLGNPKQIGFGDEDEYLATSVNNNGVYTLKSIVNNLEVGDIVQVSNCGAKQTGGGTDPAGGGADPGADPGAGAEPLR